MCLKNKIKISVIVPVFKAQNTISKCLDSLINQSLSDIEIICVNDGSSDNSLKILQEYKNKDVRIRVVNQENSGVAIARNMALTLAKGEFIGFLDSDDWVSLNFYESLYNVASQYDADIAVSSILKYYSEYQIETLLDYSDINIYEKTSEKLEVAQIPKFNYIWNKIYRRSMLLENNITFPISNMYEDAVFTLKAITLLEKMVTVPQGIYYYFDNNNSLTKSSKNLRKDFLISCRYVRNFIEEHNLSWKFLNLYPYYQKDSIKICGLPILIIKRNFVQDKIYLFGIIKIGDIFHKKRY